MSRKLLILLMVIVGILSRQAYGGPSIQLKGVFGKKGAVLVIDGQQSVVKVGAVEQGVRLLSVNKQTVVIDNNGQRQTISLSTQVGGSYKKPTKKEVRIASQEGGHYWVQGEINGGTVRFVVDTGATTISLNLSTARRLGLDYKKGTPIRVSTANGVAQASRINLDRVTIGAITQYQVAATVMMDDSLPVILLGNSFLSGVDMRTDNGVLVLTQ